MELAKLFLQLGVAGAALYVVIFLINKIFSYLEKRGNADDKDTGKKFDRLCDKIDKLVDSFHEMTQRLSEVMLNNNKDQDEIKDRLDIQHGILLEVHKKVTRIDDRTYKCLGSPEEKK